MRVAEDEKMTDHLRSLVTWERGMIYPAIYFDEDIYDLEQERVFGSAWLPVGHEDMVRNPGDYVSNYMGEVPVIVVRDREGVLHVFINKCRHRGNQVCLFDRGNVRAFTCSYHGWTYGVDGSLKSVPDERDLYHGQLDKERLGLEEVPLVNFCGLLFASLNREPPSFEDWLGSDVRWWLQNVVLGEPVGGVEALPGWHRYESPGNWKLVAENFIGDNYHFMHTHTAAIRVKKAFLEKGIRTPATTSPHSALRTTEKGTVTAGYHSGAPMGVGAMLPLCEELTERDLDDAKYLGKEAVDWVTERVERLKAAFSAYEPMPYGFGHGALFPNLGLMGYTSPLLGRHFLLFHPRGVGHHETWQWTMVEREAPECVKELAVQRVYQGQYMAGLVAPDDVENFERIVEASRAKRTWRLPMNYQIHLGHDADQFPGLPGNGSDEPNEISQREMYRAWLELMTGPLLSSERSGR